MGREVTYHISKSGTVDVELDEVQTRKFVMGGSHADSRNDPKYNGTWFLESIHGVGTWEYMWRSGHQLHVHHFDSRCGADSVSPWGSPFFYFWMGHLCIVQEHSDIYLLFGAGPSEEWVESLEVTVFF